MPKINSFQMSDHIHKCNKANLKFSFPGLKTDFFKCSLSFIINAAADLMLLKNNIKNAFRECK